MLVKITVPIAIITEILSRLGVIKAVAPVLHRRCIWLVSPRNSDLPGSQPCLSASGRGAADLHAVSVSSLSVADVTIFSALILFAHGLPIEQKIIEEGGAGHAGHDVLRIGGGLLYAFILHHILAATGWMASPVNPDLDSDCRDARLGELSLEPRRKPCSGCSPFSSH